MARVSSSVAIASVLCSALSAMTVHAVQQPVNRDAQLQVEFKQRVDKYMALHGRLEKQLPPLKEKAEIAQIKVHQDALAKGIRAERKTAKQADIFTSDIEALFRRLMYPELKGPEGAETKKVLKDEAPVSVPLKVNAVYPENAPLPTIPPNLLANLPQLPKDLEYRIVGQALILRDVHANLIVDYIPNAVR